MNRSPHDLITVIGAAIIESQQEQFEENTHVSHHDPAWIEDLVNLVSGCLEAHSAMGPLEYWYNAEAEIVELVVYPTPVELIGGEFDGAVVVPGFSLDVQSLQTAFERVNALQWCAHGMGPFDLEGAHLSLEGLYQGCQLWLRVLAEPPEETEPGLQLDTSGQG
jgi:hypothetical protein